MSTWRRRLVAALLAPVGAGALGCAGLVAWLESGPPHAPEREVRDVTGLVRIGVDHVARPTDEAEIRRLLARHDGPVSIGGGRYSMGGQIASDGTLFLDLREFDDVLELDVANRRVVVEAGISWRRLIEALDPHDLSVRTMQSYANFTVGGTLSVNAHGRYVHQGAVVHSVRSFTLVLTGGDVIRCARDEHPELFHAVIGGYGALGVISHVELDLDRNVALERQVERMPVERFTGWFDEVIRPSTTAVFFNADLYPPAYDELVAITFSETDRPVTITERLQAGGPSTRAERAVYWWVADGPLGKQARSEVIDRMRLASPQVVWRNWEASYDVAGLEPGSRERSTYVLQEYFLPVDRFDAFVPRMAEVFRKWDANVVNVSIRHALPDPDTLLTWAPGEVYAFVVYYQQGTSPEAQARVGEWTREMVDVVLSEGGRYYLPYQLHPTGEQLRRAYPRADEWFALKRIADPEYHLRSRFLETYWPPPPGPDEERTRELLGARPTWARAEDQTFLTLPEWYVVYSADELGEHLLGGRAHEFAYFAAIGQFWQAYRRVWRVTRDRYEFNAGYHAMIFVVGASFTVEYAVKGLWEHTVGSWLAAGPPVAEEAAHAELTAEYGAFTHHTPWYLFPFDEARARFAAVPSDGSLRSRERRLVIGGELLAKDLWAQAIGLASGAAYDPEAAQLEVWLRPNGARLDDVAGLRVLEQLPGGDVLVALPRYEPFTAAVLELVARDVDLVQIAGGDTMLVQVRASEGWTEAPLWGDVLYEWPMLSDPTQRRWALEIPVRRLDEALPELAAGATIERLYDF